MRNYETDSNVTNLVDPSGFQFAPPLGGHGAGGGFGGTGLGQSLNWPSGDGALIGGYGAQGGGVGLLGLPPRPSPSSPILKRVAVSATLTIFLWRDTTISDADENVFLDDLRRTETSAYQFDSDVLGLLHHRMRGGVIPVGRDHRLFPVERILGRHVSALGGPVTTAELFQIQHVTGNVRAALQHTTNSTNGLQPRLILFRLTRNTHPGDNQDFVITAETDRNAYAINLYLSWWRDPPHERVRTLYHELTHLAAMTNDQQDNPTPPRTNTAQKSEEVIDQLYIRPLPIP
jgi:hypothetical protein